MFRTQVYLSDSAHEKLSKVAQMSGKSQSELLRQAVDEFLDKKNEKHRIESIRKAAGIWKHRTDLPDFEEIRRSADREIYR
jgi:metal-responsive CopG/Arc/MetJ family transcriptional regulator